MTSTEKPSLASDMAHAAPAGPAPTTTALLSAPAGRAVPLAVS